MLLANSSSITKFNTTPYQLPHMDLFKFWFWSIRFGLLTKSAESPNLDFPLSSNLTLSEQDTIKVLDPGIRWVSNDNRLCCVCGSWYHSSCKDCLPNDGDPLIIIADCGFNCGKMDDLKKSTLFWYCCGDCMNCKSRDNITFLRNCSTLAAVFVSILDQ